MSSHKKLAFSLIEIMVGLIVVSVMVAAFAPVITKKVSNTTVALSQQDNVAGKVIKSKLYNFSTALDGVDGCSLTDSNTALKCPFEVPEGVTSVNFILVSGGGGGAGGGANTTTTAPVNLSNGQSQKIYVNKFMRNVKISFMASAGGGGGGGYYYYNHTDSSVKRPQNQSDCDKILSGALVYTSANSCITKANLSEKSVSNSTITYLGKTNNAYSADKGNKVCWSNTASNNDSKVARSAVRHVINAASARHSGDTATHTSSYPVCTYPAAVEICSLYAPSAAYDGYKVQFRLPNSAEAAFVANSSYKNNVEAFYYDGVNVAKSHKCFTHKDTHSIAVHQYYFNDTGCSDTSEISSGTHTTDPYFYDICLPEYVWGKDQHYYLLKPEASYYAYYENCGSKCGGWSKYKRGVRAIFVDSSSSNPGNIKINPTKCYTEKTPRGGSSVTTFETRGLTFINKERAPFSVRCVVDTIGTIAATDTYIHSSGGGGGSGQYLSSVTIPQSTINSAVDGGYIDVKAGAAGSGGNGSGNGGTSYNGSDGGDSYVKVYNRYGSLLWQATLKGGKGGGKGTSSSAGSGASASTTYYLSTSTSHTNGNAGSNGTHQTSSGSAPGGYGGAAVNGYASGGAGGAATDNSASSGGSGGAGYVSLSYQTTYLGAPGGGGAGGKIVRYEGINVTEGSKIWVKVGGGGYAGSNANGGNGGQSAFGGYYVKGGGGGKRGANQTASSNPSPGVAGSVLSGATTAGAIFYKDGSSGGAASINTSNLYGTGGVGGNGGLSNYYLSIGKGYTDLSVGCGGYYTNSTYLCNNAANKNASYTGDEFANPGKVHREGSTKYGTAGSGGGGGGIDPNSTTPGAASRGQDGYVYIWWEDFAD